MLIHCVKVASKIAKHKNQDKHSRGDRVKRPALANRNNQRSDTDDTENVNPLSTPPSSQRALSEAQSMPSEAEDSDESSSDTSEERERFLYEEFGYATCVKTLVT